MVNKTPELKLQLKGLYRTNHNATSRLGCLRLDMNECVPGLPERFVKDVFSSINCEFLASYPEYDKLQKAIARHDRIKPENICLGNGSDGVIKYIFDAYISQRDEVVMTDPTFAMYPVYCSMMDAKQVFVNYGDDFKFPSHAFIKAITPKTKMAVIINPNNPTGSVIGEKEFEIIAKKTMSLGVLLIVDEAYHYFYPETFISCIKKYPNLIVLRTFSKLCGIAASRIGYAASSPEIVESLKKVRPTYDVNAVSALFAERIMNNDKLIKNLISKAMQGKEFLIKKLKSANIEYRDGHANFILIKTPGKVPEIIAQLKEYKVLINGNFKQKYLKDYLRVTIGDLNSMKHFWIAFSKVIKQELP